MMTKYFVNRHPQTRLALLLFALFSIGAALTVYTRDVSAQDISKLNRFVQTKTPGASMQVFREGRDLIEAQNWQKAAEKFNDFIKGYPKDRDVDAAIYWYGYALEKQGRKGEAAVQLERLISSYPNSSWRQEATALLVAMGEGDRVQKSVDRDNCEIKILALQSLFQADEERAISIIQQALKANPAPCQNFQAAAVTILGSRRSPRTLPILLDVARSNPDPRLRLTAIKRLGDQRDEAIIDELIKLYDADQTKEIRVQIIRALGESRTPHATAKILAIARSADEVPVRQYAIRYIGELKDPASLDELIKIYDADKNREIRGQVVHALMRMEDPRARAKVLEIARTGEPPELRYAAIESLSVRGAAGYDDLLQLYNSEKELRAKQAIMRGLMMTKDPRAQTKLLEILRSSEEAELRAFALSNLRSKDDPQVFEQLVAMYDTEQNLMVKQMLLQVFGRSPNKSGIRKLMTIARNDPSVEMRKRAVQFLGQSKDPEAMKFLEDLLK